MHHQEEPQIGRGIDALFTVQGIVRDHELIVITTGVLGRAPVVVIQVLWGDVHHKEAAFDRRATGATHIDGAVARIECAHLLVVDHRETIALFFRTNEEIEKRGHLKHQAKISTLTHASRSKCHGRTSILPTARDGLQGECARELGGGGLGIRKRCARCVALRFYLLDRGAF